MKSQAQWVDTIKNMCQSCHALGSRGVREVPKMFINGNDSHSAWALRTVAGQAMEYMATVLNIKLKPEVLPFSNIPAYLPPFWLNPQAALRVV